MRILLHLLLLSPCLALAAPYKCADNGQTTYSQYPCGPNAKLVQSSLAGVGDSNPGKPVASSETASLSMAVSSAPASAPTASPGEPLSVAERQAECRAKLQAYQKSLACFAPYRHSATWLDPEAFNHCTVVVYPDGCSSSEFR